MSDEALSAHLDWLEHCAKAQGMDYETWLEKRVTQLEAELMVAWESDRSARVFNVEYSGRAQKAEAQNAALKRENEALREEIRAGCLLNGVAEEQIERYMNNIGERGKNESNEALLTQRGKMNHNETLHDNKRNVAYTNGVSKHDAYTTP